MFYPFLYEFIILKFAQSFNMTIKINEIDQFDASIHNEELTFNELLSFDRNQLAIVSKDNHFGVIDQEGNIVIPFQYQQLVLSTIHNVYSAKRDEMWGFITRSNQVLIPLVYELTSDFIEHLCAVKKDDKWGFIDLLNTTVIPFLYDGCTDFSQGYAGIMQNQQWGAIDKTNHQVIPFQYAYVSAAGDGYFTVGKESSIKVERPDLLAYFPYFLSNNHHLLHFGLINQNNELILDYVSELPILESFEQQPVVRQNYQQGYLKNNTDFTAFDHLTIDPYEEKILKQLGVMS